MALRDLLVHVDGVPHSLKRLQLAGDLARRHGSRLTVFYCRERSQAQLGARKSAELGLASAAELANLDQQVEASLDASFASTRAAAEAVAEEFGIQVGYWIADGPAGSFLPQRARFADLCILSHSLSAQEDAENYRLSEKLLFTSGRPVLSIPDDQAFLSLGRHVAVAWNSSRPAARSVNDAMPLIELADRVTVVAVNPSDYLTRPGALPVAHLLEHLRLHGAIPDLVELEHVPPQAIGDTLQAKAGEIGADLLIAGAFGHPQLWERLLGGATRDLLDRLMLPVLMSY